MKNRLSYYLRRVASGETVTVLDRGAPVAQITPLAAAPEEFERLAAAGIVKLPLNPLPDDFWSEPLPRADASVAAALNEDRADRF